MVVPAASLLAIVALVIAVVAPQPATASARTCRCSRPDQDRVVGGAPATHFVGPMRCRRD